MRFTNGLTVYLTGETDLFGAMKAIVLRFCRPNLVVINMGDIVALGSDEAAFAVQELIKPRTVIPSHINEAGTTDGLVNPGTELDRFVEQLSRSEIDVVIPLSGVTREFNGRGRCVNC